MTVFIAVSLLGHSRRVITRACGVSSTLRSFASITEASEYWVAPFAGDDSYLCGERPR